MTSIRKFVTYEEEILVEGFKEAKVPLRMYAVAAVVYNPWAGQYVEDLRTKILELSPGYGEQMTQKLMDIAGGGDAIEAYGKAAIVGLDGEIEHASGMIHTLRFGNHFRNAVKAKSYLAFTNVRGGANTPLMIPLMDKNDAGRRSHYMTIQFSISDAPRADEIVIAIGGASGGRPHHRIGDRYQDLKELGSDLDNPASV